MTEARPRLSDTPWFLVPWFTLIVALVAGLSPPGQEIIGAALRYSVTDWMRDLWVAVTVSYVAITIILSLIEWFIRRRIQRRRTIKKAGDHLG